MRPAFGALGLAALAMTAAGCFGAAVPSPPAPPPATHVVVRYALFGRAVTSPAMLGGYCPALARCRDVRIRGSRPRRWELVAVRTLTCRPDGGAYAHPAAACRALRGLARLEARKPHEACACPLEIAPIPTAVGWVDHRRVRFALGPCAACALGGRAWQDMRALMPA